MAGPSSRVLTLLSLLQVRRDWAGEVLAERLGVSPRTVRRDVERLRGLGYRVESLRGPAGGYRLASGSELPPLRFDDDQAVAVALALAVAPASGADVAEAAARALATVRQVMPARLRHRVDAIEVVPTPGTTVASPEVLVAVSDATRRHEVLRFDHAAGGEEGDRRTRRVEPHAVVARDGRWYLLAWDDEARVEDGRRAGDWRTFRVDRIVPGPPTRRPFVPRPIPGGDAALFVAARFKGSSVEDAWPCRGTAVVHLPASAIAPFVDAHDRLEPVGPRRTSVSAGSWSWPALVARLAGFGAPIEVVGPQPLVDAAADLGRMLLAAADPGGSGSAPASSSGGRPPAGGSP